MERENEYIHFILKKESDIITPGLHFIFKKPYYVLVERWIQV